MTDVNNLILLISRLQGDLDETQRRLKAETLEKERALTRLSSIAGTKLTYNNPGITDLSDKNRPQKIGENFNELYDNEWTEAVDQLSEDHGEEGAVQMLREALKFIANKTKSSADKQYKNLQEALFQRDLRESEAGNFMTIYKKISDLQKDVSSISVANAKKFLKEDTKFVSKYKDVLFGCEAFVYRCIELCWMMHIQDPPMYLKFESPNVIDKNIFRLFTRSGERPDYVVWPALLLHEDGPLVQKGVVQPVKSNTAGKNSTPITSERTINK
ncbi:uncharacterized protein LOC133192535 [Saccostrea echinata]|uniref:uncharacterized protein LOC133192535 n=1 Tax=Saccostrea echinata TaxID=191078 RepID=UPI002A80AD3F|nr:uncharacterized protein LOC133192535 [Saccostrea echinata]